MLNSEEFLDLLAQHESQIMALLWAISPGSDVAEDLFQQTVLTMWQKIDTFESGTNFPAWACSIARLKSLEFARNRRRLLFDNDIVAQLADEYGSEENELRLARRRALVNCLRQLRSKDQDLVQSCYQGDRTINQAAAEIGRTAKSVYQALARIRKTLHRCVQSKLAQEEHGNA
jgi:RNA polymerase sigma-70 factor (ECF subfamily)